MRCSTFRHDHGRLKAGVRAESLGICTYPDSERFFLVPAHHT